MFRKDRSYHSINAPRYIGLGFTLFASPKAEGSTFSEQAPPAPPPPPPSGGYAPLMTTGGSLLVASVPGGYAPQMSTGGQSAQFTVPQASALSFQTAGVRSDLAMKMATGFVSRIGQIDPTYKLKCEKDGGIAYLDANNIQACRAAGTQQTFSVLNSKDDTISGRTGGGVNLPGSGGGDAGGGGCPAGQLVLNGQCVDPYAVCKSYGQQFVPTATGGACSGGGGGALPDAGGNCPPGTTKSDQNTCVDPYAICVAQGQVYDPSKNPSECSPKSGSSAMILGVAALAALLLLR